jgi:hypothetical protein
MGNASHCSKDRDLDKAIEQTFPASDPIAPGPVTGTERPGSNPSRKAPVISSQQVEEAAAETEVCSRCEGEGVRHGKECSHCRGHGRLAIADDLIVRKK